MKKAWGIILLVFVFGGLFTLCAIGVGFWETLTVLGISIALTEIIVLAVKLINE